MKRIIALISFLVICTQGYTQDLYMPIEFREAYKNGTRMFDGSVSDSYRQNKASYDIKVEVDPEKKLLSGSALITYWNNSEDTLNWLTIQAYHDYYKAGAKRAGFFSDESNQEMNSDGMVFDRILVRGTEIDLTDEDNVYYNGTNYQVRNPESLPQGGQVNLEIDWHYTIPGKGFERSGAIDSTSMFIAYWYPEIAVFDDINGWDRITYDASAEFYHDISDFNVEITVPENFMVWASSELLNPDEIYPKHILKRFNKAQKSTETVHIVTSEDLEDGLKMNSSVWKYEASGFPDFAFALSDDFLWDAATYEDEYGSYFVNAAYSPKDTACSVVVQTEQEALKIFHTKYPVYPFPFKHFTIFVGLQGGGMEFPGMANNAPYSGRQYSRWAGREISDFEANLGIAVHEMFHMYFPFIMGINEKRFAWMDEGLADFADNFYPQLFDGEWDKSYLGRQYVTPMMVPTYVAPGHSGMNSYTVGSYSYYSLYHLLGHDTFTECMNEYMDRWKGKHPTPYDYFFTFNDVSGQDLNWFWKRWYFDWGYADIALKEVEADELTITNEGGRPLSFKITYTLADESEKTEMVSAQVWKDSNQYVHKVMGDIQEISRIKLTILGGSDVVLENNYWESEESD